MEAAVGAPGAVGPGDKAFSAGARPGGPSDRGSSAAVSKRRFLGEGCGAGGPRRWRGCLPKLEKPRTWVITSSSSSSCSMVYADAVVR